MDFLPRETIFIHNTSLNELCGMNDHLAGEAGLCVSIF